MHGTNNYDVRSLDSTEAVVAQPADRTTRENRAVRPSDSESGSGNKEPTWENAGQSANVVVSSRIGLVHEPSLSIPFCLS